RLGLPAGRLARAFSGRRYGRFEWFRRTQTGLDDPILDVGCGAGRLLFRMHADGFRRLVGIDPHLAPEAVRRAAGRPGLSLETASPESHRGAYHLVMAHHSFEHMAAPRGAFAAMAGLVAPGGWLLLRVPLADSWACAHYGAAWAQLDAPRHLQIPTRRSIALLAEAVGLRVEHVEDDSGPFQIVGSEAPGAGARALRWLAVRRRAAALRRSGQGDQAAFYLRRVP
ncbi:class I SAM-dependent methyltransferase, partial [Myxococcota bacterium]|nr:class I SAM-dependent methyltransferase [Myxococcota bacterium]